jgi:hypothetical protein
MEIFVGVLCDIEVVTVNTDRHGKPTSPEHWYSIVREIHLCKQCSAEKRTLEPSHPVPSNPLTPRTQTTLTTDQHSNTVNTPLARAKVERGNGIDKFG